MPQYAFFFDQSRCLNCRACVISCRDWYDIPAGPVRWLRLLEWEKGAYPNVRLNYLFVPCYHCENPVCVDAANGAMYKEGKYGAVLIDPDKARSIDLRKANEVCPYGVISFDSDAMDAYASKCTMCVDRLEQNLLPICVESCPQRALDFGLLTDLKAKYGTNSQLEDMPSPDTTMPAVVFKPKAPKRQLVPYDANKALELMAKRDPFPPIFTDKSSVTNTSNVGRGSLVLKPKSPAEALRAVQTDEG
jgi:anaerobic dimethyl sulfoxide reductase subunit B (iron-sulfur subunit)